LDLPPPLDKILDTALSYLDKYLLQNYGINH
jgi:hypothetical protein